MKKILIILLVFAVMLGVFSINIQHASAAGLTAAKDTLTREKEDTAADHTFVLTTPSGIHEGDTVALTFAAGFNIASIDVGDVTIGGNAPASAVVADQVLTITADADTVVAPAGVATIIVGITHHVTNPATHGSYIISIAGTFGDTGSLAVSIVDDDQVVVSATIDPYLTFTITTVAVTLTKAGSGNPDYSNTGFNQGVANTLAASTNAHTGYGITYSGATLASGDHAISAMAAKAASSAGTEQFGINLKDNTTPNTGAEPVGGTGAPADDYSTVDQFKFVADTTTNLANAAAGSATTTYTVTYIVNVANTTEAGAYTTTITYICTGNF